MNALLGREHFFASFWKEIPTRTFRNTRAAFVTTRVFLTLTIQWCDARRDDLRRSLRAFDVP